MPQPPQPPITATTTTFQVGTYNALTDTFTSVFDCNDFATTWVAWDSLKMPLAELIDVRGNNIRAPGEKISRIQYKNRHVTLALMLYGGSAQAVLNKEHALIQAIRNESLPYVLRVAPPGANNYSYFDVVKASWDIPYDPQQYRAGFHTQITVDFECQPGIRGDRLTLQNYVVNPGFEAPCGGASAPAVQVFSDNFATVSAYSVQSGAAPTLNPANTYVDIVQSIAGLVRFYRLDETSGTSAYDIGGSGATGTISAGGVTLGTAGLVAGDTDGAMTFAASSSGKITSSAAGLPSGNNPWSYGIAFKITANPAAASTLGGFGGGIAGTGSNLWIDTSGKLNCDMAANRGLITSASAVALNTAHLAIVEWDGTTLTLFLDGVSVGSSTPGAASIAANPPLYIGSNTGGGNTFTGVLDEPAWWSAAIGSTAVSTLWTAFHTGATGTVAGAMTIPSAGRVGFGSPAWGAIQTWQTRLRYTSGGEYRWILHYSDGNDFLYCRVRGITLELHHVVGGSDHNLATVNITLTHEAWYWIQVTQFPTVTGNPPNIQATLCYDASGVVGAQVAMVGPVATYDAVTALSGAPQLQSVAGALTIGGNYSGVQSVNLFGPGGWIFGGTQATYAPASGAWEQTSANCIPVGTSTLVPVTSLGAARVDLGPSGVFDAQWSNYNGGAPAGTPAIPATQNQVFGISAYVKAPSLGVNAVTRIVVSEWNASGAFLTNATLGTQITGAIANWTQYNNGTATYTVSNASTAYIGIALRTTDATANESANATIWWENVQVWNETTTGQTSMPYCELRFMASPAQLVVSGIQGDMPAGAHLSLGTYLPASAGSNTTLLEMFLGERGAATATAQLSGKVLPNSVFGLSPVLSTNNAYGGWYVASGSRTFTAFLLDDFTNNPAELNLAGVYHLYARVLSGESAGNLSKVSIQPTSQEMVNSGLVTQLSGPSVSPPAQAPLSTSNTWNVVDLGQIQYPLIPAGNLRDLTQTHVSTSISWTDSGGGGVIQADWWALVPVDGPLILAAMDFNGSFSPSFWGTGWLWTYFDGLARQQSKSNAPLFNAGAGSAVGGSAIPSPATGIGGSAGAANNLSLITSATPYVILDPSQQLGGVTVNEFVGFVADQNQGAWPSLPLFAELVYSPLYNYPR